MTNNKTKRDYYEVLGVPRDASLDQIKKSYRKLAMKYHPDRAKQKGEDPNKVQEFEERFKELGEAYAVLSDKEKRAAYDRFGHRAFQGGGGGGRGGFDQGGIHFEFDGGIDPFEIFSQFFGGGFEDVFGGRGRRSSSGGFGGGNPFSGFGGMGGQQSPPPQPTKGADVTIPLKLPTDEAEAGITKSITMTVNKGGQKSKESFKVKVPPRTKDGQKLRLKGRGKPGKHGGPNGDLFVQISLVPAEPQRQKHRLNLMQALLGAQVEVDTPAGEQKLTIPPGTQNGATFLLTGKGELIGESKKRKDLELEIRVVLPHLQTQEQKDLAKKLGESLGML